MSALEPAIPGFLNDEPAAPEPAVTRFTLAMLEAALRDQADLTAVERFSQKHEHDEIPLRERYYKDLLPASPPGPGQQYGFEVDLDACTGCKACVTACHSMNGLDEGEAFRTVGLLHGGSPIAPFQQTVTTACHHCVDPACMAGCPVLAYEKDPVTGIVRHLDDQCIGCQYCVFTCPYEVPRFHEAKGIVRKCDMCQGRLSVGEAPACVQGCPNGAIAIRVVDVASAVRDAEGEAFLPGTPDPAITVPTTSYKTERAIPRNVLAADHFAVKPAHAHRPLVVMLVLTQLSAGAFAVDQLLPAFLPPALAAALRPFDAFFGFAVGLLALSASVFHLGRPQYAFRAILGIRRSWLSREILAFGAFAGLAAANAFLLSPLARDVAAARLLPSTVVLGRAVAAMGLLGVFTSVMVYAVTHKKLWSLPRTALRFFGTSAVLGTGTVLFAATLFVPRLVDVPAATTTAFVGRLVDLLALVTALRLVVDSVAFVHLRDRTLTELKATALLLVGPLRDETWLRYTFSILGGFAVPRLLFASGPAGLRGEAPILAGLALVLLVGGELLERSAFFRAARAPRMPGGLSA